MAVIAALDAKTDLTGVVIGGLINEDVMQRIWDVSRIPLPYLDRIGAGRVSAAQHDWVVDKLAAAALNLWVETANFSTTTASGVTDFADSASAPAARYRNHVQISVKAISVSEMADSVSSVGGSGGLEYNLMVAQQELMRDIELTCLSNQASAVGNSTTTAPACAGYAASIKDQTVPTRNLVDTAGTEGGWDATSLFIAYTPGTARGITETLVRDMAQALYIGGCGGPDESLVAMCAASLKRTVSQYFYTSGARVASLIKDVGNAGAGATAQGSVEFFITDFGTLELVPNRLQVDLGTNQYGFYMFDPNYIELVYLRGPTTTAGAKLGLIERRIVNAYWSTRFNPSCMGGILDINPATAMVA